MGIVTVGMINSSGGKIYSRNITSPTPTPGRDPWEWACSVLSSYIYGYSKQISPTPADEMDASPVRLIEGTRYDIHLFWTPSKIGFFALVTSGHPVRREQFSEMYVAYTDLVVKHPVYIIDTFGFGQPINAETFSAFSTAVDAIWTKPRL